MKSHEGEGLRLEARRLGIVLGSLSPYSPDLNSIEYMSNKVKNVMSIRLARDVSDMKSITKETYQPMKTLASHHPILSSVIPSFCRKFHQLGKRSVNL